MPKQLQTVVRHGRKLLANKWLEHILTTRDTCFFFQSPGLSGDATLQMKQKFLKERLTWRHIRPSVSRHYLKDSPYKELQCLLQGPVMIAYPEENEDLTIKTKTVLGLAKEFNLGLMGAKWRNVFITPDDVKELQSESMYRGEMLSLFVTYHDGVARALKSYIDRETGGGEDGDKKVEAVEGEPVAAATAPPPAEPSKA